MQTCLLPGGYIDPDGYLHREIVLRPLTGREEELLASQSNLSSAKKVTVLLSQCLQRIGSIAPVTETITRLLTVGDRHYALLQLRALTFGDKVEASIPCPWPDCGKQVDIDFLISQLPIRSTAIQPVYTLVFSPEAMVGIESVEFRLPNGADQEIVSPRLAHNEAEALTLLLCRCIHRLGEVVTPSAELIQTLSPLARLEIEKHMESMMPTVELTMGANCPECGRDFTVPFDIQDFFFGELRISEDLLRREVHYLAYHYHWSEQEILSLPRDKRRAYIEILAEEIERLNDAME